MDLIRIFWISIYQTWISDQDLYLYVVDGETAVSSVILFDTSEDYDCINDALEETEWCEASNKEGVEMNIFQIFRTIPYS